MAKPEGVEWTGIYETRSSTDADIVRTTLEVAGFRVAIEGAEPTSIIAIPSTLTVAVPSQDADDARGFLRQKTSLLSPDVAAPGFAGDTADQPESLPDAVQEILEVRRQHEVAACKYCGIPTLDVGERDLD